MIQGQPQELSPLRRQWLLVALFYAGGLLAGYYLLLQGTNTQFALQWLIVSATAMAIQLGILWWALPYNRRQGHSLAVGEHADLLSSLGYANGITLLRGLLACMLAGFLFAPLPSGWLAWAPALLYTLDRLVDFADGYVARITRSETKLGEILDIEFDGLGILIAIALGIQYGKLPPWYLLLGLARQLFVLGMWLLRRADKPVYDLPPSEHRRMIAGFQTGFITVVLWPLWPPPVTLLAAYVMAIPLVFSFGRDWLVVSGVIDADSPGYGRARALGKLWLESWAPVVARLAAVILALPILLQPGAGGSDAAAVLSLLVIPGWAAAASVLFGIAARVGALVLAAIAALQITAAGMQWDSSVLLICAIVVVHLGPGKWALWRPEEPILRAKAGAPRA
jgi:CDP-diacylglycerol--glycerol-3-phosphate 3-phosphatidyltransferase